MKPIVIEPPLDVVYFTTMINNLLSNAVKYSDKDPEIKIEGYSDRDKIYISVADNGVGSAGRPSQESEDNSSEKVHHEGACQARGHAYDYPSKDW